MKKRFYCGAFFLLFSISSFLCAAKPFIPRETLFSFSDRYEVTISPNGKQIAYLSTQDGILNIWVQTIGQEDARMITQSTKAPIQSYCWSVDGKYILYKSDNDGDENFSLFSINLSTNQVKNLTPEKNAQARILHQSEREPNCVLVLLNDRDPTAFDPYKINIESGEKEKLYLNDQGFYSFVADDDFQLRAALRMRDSRNELWIRKNNKQPFRLYKSYPLEDNRDHELLSVSSDGQNLFFIDSENVNTKQLKLYSFLTENEKVLFHDPKADIENVFVDPTTSEPQFVTTYREKQNIHLIDPSIKESWSALASKIDNQYLARLKRTKEGQWLVGVKTDTQPLSYSLFNEKNHNLDFLFYANNKLVGLEFCPTQICKIRSRDGLELFSYLTLPKENLGQANLLILLVHGGPWYRDKFEYNPIHQWLANRGYAVLSVNFRGSTGFGKAFLNAGNREWAHKMHDDLVDAVNWSVERGIADKNKVVIMGGSYGGYASLVGLTFTPDLFIAGVSINGPSDVYSLLKSVPPQWKAEEQEFSLRVGPLEDKEYLSKISPLNYSDQISKPLLIIQGQNDVRVPVDQSERIVETLKANHIPVTYALFPDEGHGFCKEQNQIATFALIEDFLSQIFDVKHEPLESALEGSSVIVQN